MTETKHFFVIIRPPRPTFSQDMTETEKNIMSKHFEYLKKLLDTNKLLLAGPCTDGAFGVIILITTKSLEEAINLVNNDPIVETNIMTPEIHSLGLSSMKK